MGDDEDAIVEWIFKAMGIDNTFVTIKNKCLKEQLMKLGHKYEMPREVLLGYLQGQKHI